MDKIEQAKSLLNTLRDTGRLNDDEFCSIHDVICELDKNCRNLTTEIRFAEDKIISLRNQTVQILTNFDCALEEMKEGRSWII